MICRTCREVTKYGWRHGRPGWWHREDKPDHEAFPIVAPDVVEEEVVPPVEVPMHTVTADDFAPRSGIRQIINLVNKTEGWDLVRLTASRGPYLGAKGQVLSISDFVVLGARCPRLDGSVGVAVGSWRDAKFEIAYIGNIANGVLSPRRVNSTGMKNWIKGASLEEIPEETTCSESE